MFSPSKSACGKTEMILVKRKERHMKFEEGLILEEFETNGKKIIFRYIKTSDTKNLMNSFNKVMDETQFLAFRHKVKIAEEKKWVNGCIKDSKKGNNVLVIVENDNKIIGCASVRRDTRDAMYYIGEFGIWILKDYKSIGIGTRLTKKVLDVVKKETDMNIIISGYFQSNELSKKLHEKFGFKKYGVLPKSIELNGDFVDEILIYKVLK